MFRVLAAILVTVLLAGTAFGKDSLTGQYSTKQTNLTGTLKVKLLPDNQVKFEIQTVKKGGGDYKGSVTTCSAEGVATMENSSRAVYEEKEDHMDKPFKLTMSIKKSSIKIDSNADEVAMCGMGAWLDGTYQKNNSKEPKFSE